MGFTGSTYVAKAGGVTVKFGPWLFNDVDREENLPIVMKELAVSIGRKYAHSQADARLKKTTAEHLARGLMSKLSLQKVTSIALTLVLHILITVPNSSGPITTSIGPGGQL